MQLLVAVCTFVQAVVVSAQTSTCPEDWFGSTPDQCHIDFCQCVGGNWVGPNPNIPSPQSPWLPSHPSNPLNPNNPNSNPNNPAWPYNPRNPNAPINDPSKIPCGARPTRISECFSVLCTGTSCVSTGCRSNCTRVNPNDPVNGLLECDAGTWRELVPFTGCIPSTPLDPATGPRPCGAAPSLQCYNLTCSETNCLSPRCKPECQQTGTITGQYFCSDGDWTRTVAFSGCESPPARPVVTPSVCPPVADAFPCYNTDGCTASGCIFTSCSAACVAVGPVAGQVTCTDQIWAISGARPSGCDKSSPSTGPSASCPGTPSTPGNCYQLTCTAGVCTPGSVCNTWCSRTATPTGRVTCTGGTWSVSLAFAGCVAASPIPSTVPGAVPVPPLAVVSCPASPVPTRECYSFTCSPSSAPTACNVASCAGGCVRNGVPLKGAFLCVNAGGVPTFALSVSPQGCQRSTRHRDAATYDTQFDAEIVVDGGAREQTVDLGALGRGGIASHYDGSADGLSMSLLGHTSHRGVDIGTSTDASIGTNLDASIRIPPVVAPLAASRVHASDAPVRLEHTFQSTADDVVALNKANVEEDVPAPVFVSAVPIGHTHDATAPSVVRGMRRAPIDAPDAGGMMTADALRNAMAMQTDWLECALPSLIAGSVTSACSNVFRRCVDARAASNPNYYPGRINNAVNCPPGLSQGYCAAHPLITRAVAVTFPQSITLCGSGVVIGGDGNTPSNFPFLPSRSPSDLLRASALASCRPPTTNDCNNVEMWQAESDRLGYGIRFQCSRVACGTTLRSDGGSGAFNLLASASSVHLATSSSGSGGQGDADTATTANADGDAEGSGGSLRQVNPAPIPGFIPSPSNSFLQALVQAICPDTDPNCCQRALQIITCSRIDLVACMCSGVPVDCPTCARGSGSDSRWYYLLLLLLLLIPAILLIALIAGWLGLRKRKEMYMQEEGVTPVVFTDQHFVTHSVVSDCLPCSPQCLPPPPPVPAYSIGTLIY